MSGLSTLSSAFRNGHSGEVSASSQEAAPVHKTVVAVALFLGIVFGIFMFAFIFSGMMSLADIRTGL